jgi:hypothetical protein
MRLFQNSGLYPSYLGRLNQLASGSVWFRRTTSDLFGQSIWRTAFLKPVLEKGCDTFFTNGDDNTSQGFWAAKVVSIFCRYGSPIFAAMEGQSRRLAASDFRTSANIS